SVASISRVPEPIFLPSVATIPSLMPISQTVVSAAVASVPLRITRSKSLIPSPSLQRSTTPLLPIAGQELLWRIESTARRRDRHDRSNLPSADHRRDPARDLGRPLLGGDRGLR